MIAMSQARILLLTCISTAIAWCTGNILALQHVDAKVNGMVYATIYHVGGIPINPFAFINLYQDYARYAPNLFEKAMLFQIGLPLIVFVAMAFMTTQFGQLRTSEGTAKWATHSDLRKKKVLVDPNDTNKVSGVIVGTWYSGCVNYETFYNFMQKLRKACPFKYIFKRMSNDTYFMVIDFVAALLSIKREYIVDNAPTHVFLCAPSRSGKGIGPITSTLLHYKGSMIVADLKGENMRETGPYRQFVLGHKVLAFAPTDTRPTARFNPVNEIRWGTPNEGKDVENICTLLVGKPEGKDAHWKSNAISLIKGALTHLKYKHAAMNHKRNLSFGDEGYIETNFYHVYEFLTNTNFDPDEDAYETMNEKLERELKETEHFPAYLEVHNETLEKPMLVRFISVEKAPTITTFSHEALKTPKKHPVVAASFQSFLSKPEQEGGSVLSTAVTALAMFSEKIIVDNTCTSDFVIGDIRNSKTPVDLFLQVPPSDLERVEKLFALIFEFIIQRVTENEEKAKSERPCLLLIDEWPAFGKMSTLVKELGFIASYGLKTFLIVQGLDQVKEIYGDKLPFLSNCQTQIFFEGKDDSTPKYVAEKLGRKTITIKQKSSDGGILSKTNTTVLEKGRQLMDASEVATMHNTSIMFLDEHKVKSTKLKWFITSDLSWRLNEGKRRDKYKHVGMRPMDANNNSLETIRFYTDYEEEDLENVIYGMCQIDDESIVDKIKDRIRFTKAAIDLINTTSQLTPSMAEYEHFTTRTFLSKASVYRPESIAKEMDDIRELLTNEMTLLPNTITTYMDAIERLANMTEEEYVATTVAISKVFPQKGGLH